MNRAVRATGDHVFQLAPSSVLLARQHRELPVSDADHGQRYPRPR